jgi:hypothetical protein
MAETKKGTGSPKATETSPAVETVATETPVQEVVVTEGEPKASTEVAPAEPAAPAAVVPTAAAATPARPKVRLFWQKTCHSLKESTNTEIKDDEVFVRTSHQVMVLPEGATEPVANLVYSLKRGKRIYYTPASYLTPEMMAAANAATDAKNVEKDAKAKAAADEKAKKDAEKAAKAATEPKVVGGPAVVAPAAVAAPAATLKEEDME